MSGQDFGYRQELNRTMGGFSSFAVSFSLISVLTGIFANFNFGFREVGGWLVWSWSFVAVGQYLIARVMARLSVRFPIAGYGYQWTARLINPHFGFFIGWMLLAQFLTGFPGIAQTAAVAIVGIGGRPVDQNSVLILTLIIITSVTAVHLWGIRAAALVNDLGVYAELLGVAVIILMLASALWFISGTGFTNVLYGIQADTDLRPDAAALARSLLLGAWCLTGFEAAADLAEETESAQEVVPKAVVRSLISASIAGLLLLSLLTMVAGDLAVAQDQGNPLMEILHSSIGATATAVIMVFVVISILACAVASMATASRLLFSMSRDRMLPGSKWLSQVNPRSRTPQSATLTVWAFSCMAVLLFRRIEIITAVSALATFIGYAGIMYACVRETKGLLPKAAFLWSLLAVGALAIPETEIAGVVTRHLPAWSAFVVLVAGSAVYVGFVRNKIRTGKAGPPGM